MLARSGRLRPPAPGHTPRPCSRCFRDRTSTDCFANGRLAQGGCRRPCLPLGCFQQWRSTVGRRLQRPRCSSISFERWQFCTKLFGAARCKVTPAIHSAPPSSSPIEQSSPHTSCHGQVQAPSGSFCSTAGRRGSRSGLLTKTVCSCTLSVSSICSTILSAFLI